MSDFGCFEPAARTCDVHGVTRNPKSDIRNPFLMNYDSISSEALLSLDSMEGVYALPVVEKREAAAAAPAKRPSVWPGYYLTALTAPIAFAIHSLPLAPFRVSIHAHLPRPP